MEHCNAEVNLRIRMDNLSAITSSPPKCEEMRHGLESGDRTSKLLPTSGSENESYSFNANASSTNDRERVESVSSVFSDSSLNTTSGQAETPIKKPKVSRKKHE